MLLMWYIRKLKAQICYKVRKTSSTT